MRHLRAQRLKPPWGIGARAEARIELHSEDRAEVKPMAVPVAEGSKVGTTVRTTATPAATVGSRPAAPGPRGAKLSEGGHAPS